ncbi:MAG: hypothetical protein C4542_07430 [Dehalococcoidia bacterium]|nr:MAG: hypothetical protein C4542_07430 [Dehalococcoidia bacterium]
MVRQPVNSPPGSSGDPSYPAVTVVGVDPSLAHTGVCVLTDGRVVQEYALETAPGDGPRPLRLYEQRERLARIVLSARDSAAHVVVALESEIWLSNAHTASEAAAIQAVYQVVLWESRWPTLHFLPVNVAHVKKYCGAQQKDEVLLQVYKRWGREYKDHNLADAFVLARIGHDFHTVLTGSSTGDRLTKPQREVLLKLAYTWEQQAAPKEKRRDRQRKRLTAQR